MKAFLNKILKIFIILLIASALITLGILLFIYAGHASKLKKEASLLAKTPGEVYDIDGTKVHVYVDGKEDADDTIVFIHGSGNVDGTIAIRPLVDELSDEYRFIYIERPGYGYSGSGDENKSNEAMAELTLKALEKTGVEGPYIFLSQTTGGLLTLYIEEKHPELVKAVIGLNMVLPEDYDNYEDNGVGSLAYFVSKYGIIRHMTAVYPRNNYGLYNNNQMTLRNALISRGSYTKDMLNEDKAIVQNAAELREEELPSDIPVFMIITNPIMEPYVSTDETVKAEYEDMQNKYPDYDFVKAYNKEKIEDISAYKQVSYIEVAGPADYYTYAPLDMSQHIKSFLGGL